MDFNVENFNNQYLGDYARSNLFMVKIAGIGAIHGGPEGGGMFVKGASLPETTVGMVEVPYQNRKLKIPGDRTFADWTATVIQDEAYSVRNQLLGWQADITGFNTFTSVHTVGAAHRLITIQPYNRDGSEAPIVANVYGWPSSIGSVDLSWETADTIQEYTVTFTISWDDGGVPGESNPTFVDALGG
jgi:hypothetical protein